MILIKPPLTVSDGAFRFFNGLDASKRMKLDLSEIPANTVVTLGVKSVGGEIVVGQFDTALKAYLIEE